MKEDYFYSRSTGQYVSRKPLVIDARVKDAAERAGLKLDWNDEGIINNINYDDSKVLMESLGSKMLTPLEYWKVFNDAVEDSDMAKELCSDRYTEWLDRVYTSENEFIDSPAIVSQYKYDGKMRKSRSLNARPGYFNPEENIDTEIGEPYQVDEKREKLSEKWKFWSPDLSVTNLGACAPIRGYVTSIGKPSYDLGIPVDARQPNLMIRECRYTPLEPVIDAKILEKAENYEDIIGFIKEYGKHFSTSKDSLVYKIRESFFDKLGDIALMKDVKDVKDACDVLCIIKDKKLKFRDFQDFVNNSKGNLEDAIKSNKDIVFVMGHKNPDTDTAISCLFEAYRNHLMDDNTIYVPVVQSKRIPDETSHLIGDISGKILLSDDALYAKARETGLARWISVDQNKEPEVQKYFISIIDHHIASEAAKNRDIPKTLEMLGSCSALITRKYLGMGLEMDKDMAKILYGAALMDTENRVEHKMTDKDTLLMDYLKKESLVENDNEFYGDLMSYLLNTDDADILFKRDYKEDWGFGFAVAKIKNGFNAKGDFLKDDLVGRLYDMAAQNNIEKNLPLTLLKVTDYNDDNETVNKERLYFVLNDATEGFKNTTRKALESIIRFEFPGDNVTVGDDYIDFWGSGLQLSRKKTAPVLEPLSAAFNRYFYSPSISKWVKRDFQKKTSETGGNYSTDGKGRINYINYEEAKSLCEKMKYEILSLNEYWKVLNDAKDMQDIQMIDSLQGSNFVEFLDSMIIDRKYLVDHDGERIKVDVPRGKPGLIHPDDINIDTGLPMKVREPNEYGNQELWRYWEPDADLVVPCRSYIFVLDQPCLDGKFKPDESFPNLGLRPVVQEVKEPDVKMEWDENFLNIVISEEGESKQWKWPKRIWDYSQTS